MTIEEAFKILLDNWKSQDQDFKNKYKSYKSKYLKSLTDKKAEKISECKQREMLEAAKYLKITFNLKKITMKTIIFILALIPVLACSKKENVTPVSKSAALHIEYTATDPNFSAPFQSRVDLRFGSGTSPANDKVLFSTMSKSNVIVFDTIVEGGKTVNFYGNTLDPYASNPCGPYSNITRTLKVTFNGKEISNKTCNNCNCFNSFNGQLEFIK